MKDKNFLDFLPSNFRHEKIFLNQNKLIDYEKLCILTDHEIYNIQRKNPLCTFNNFKKIRAIAIFKKEIAISPSEANLLLHCGIGSINSLARMTPIELDKKIGRLKRSLRVRTEKIFSLSDLKGWILRAQKVRKYN